MKRLLLFLLSCHLLPFNSASAKTVEMGKINIHLNSETMNNNDADLFEDMLSITTKYLIDYFNAYYQIDSRYFKSVTLRLRPFDIQTESDDTKTAHLEFAGILLFSVEPTPPTTQVEKLVENAFAGRNLGKFLEALLRSNNDFLKSLQNIEIAVRDNVLVQDLSSEEEPAESANDANDVNNDELLTGWMAIMVYGVAIVTGIILAIICVVACRCCWCYSSRKASHVSPQSIDVSNKSNRKIQKQTKKQKKKNQKMKKQEKRDEMEKLQLSLFNDHPPSPDKSEYSYNNNDMSMISTDSGAMSLMSKASLGLSNYNKTTETSFSTPTGRKNPRRSSSASVPYGQDVSLLDDVQLNGLGQIEEDDESVHSIPSRSSLQAKKVHPDSGLEIRKGKNKARPESKLRQPSPRFQFGNRNERYSGIADPDDYLTESHTGSTSPTSSASSGELDFRAGPVDMDLDDLSFQIKSSKGSNHQRALI
ncbi:unnamed protein product [Cylindrotheca closterium]|uniref:SEA domain-containing protein n=1 Tax=Cylindrotheca closterium TaxID=2856 RepID=A0AAD2CVX6_9STRA|nr:unnamed protein product [Cylindrotheca closterium]